MFPVLGYFGNTEIRTNMVLIIIGIVTGLLILFFNMKSLDKQKRNKTLLFAFLIFIPFLIGVRLGYIFELISAGDKVCLTMNGGGSLWWGLLLATLSSFFIAKPLKVNVWETADYFSISLAIGAFFTRLGCLFQGCCFGIPVSESHPLATHYSLYAPAYAIYGDLPLLPTQIISALAWLLIFIILQKRLKNITFHGELILIMAGTYSIFRFIINFFRYYPSESLFTTAQIASISIFLISTVFFIFFKKIGYNSIK